MTTKIDEAINELRTEGQQHGRSSTYLTVAAALEELRSTMEAHRAMLVGHEARLHRIETWIEINNAPTVTTAVPNGFEPWDVVKDRDGIEYLVIRAVHADYYHVYNVDAEREDWFYSDELTLVSRRGKPAEPAFKVGDWARERVTGIVFQVAGISYENCVYNHDRTIYSHVSCVDKIDPPAPRFTFGQRVRWNAYPSVQYLFLNMDAGSATIVDTYGQIAYPLIENVELDTDPA